MIYTDGSHLVADTIDELHSFALSIGMKKEWFRNTTMPHYSIHGRIREKALKEGAEMCSSLDVFYLCNKMINNENKLS